MYMNIVVDVDFSREYFMCLYVDIYIHIHVYTDVYIRMCI